MAKSSSEMKNLFEIKRCEGTGFNLWKERMQGILFLKECEGALAATKPDAMTEADWLNLNRKAITYIKMAVVDEILVDIKGLPTAYVGWEKLKATYEITTPVNQVHLMRKLVSLQLDEPKSAAKHLSLFTGTSSQLQDSGLSSFDDKLKAIFLLMTLPDSWETLVVYLTNSQNLTFDGI